MNSQHPQLPPVQGVIIRVYKFDIDCKKYGDFQVCNTQNSGIRQCSGNCVETCGEKICLRDFNTDVCTFIYNLF